MMQNLFFFFLVTNVAEYVASIYLKKKKNIVYYILEIVKYKQVYQVESFSYNIHFNYYAYKSKCLYFLYSLNFVLLHEVA